MGNRSGNGRFEGGTEVVSEHRRHTSPIVKRSLGATFALLLGVLTLAVGIFGPSASQPAAAQQTDWAPPSTVYIPETGHSLDGLFLDLWRNAGGANAYGYPITPEFTLDNGHVVQYMQYARFEYWPEGDANGNTVILGKVGEELRPMSLQRSLIATTKPEAGSGALQSARVSNAWLPIDGSKVNTADGTSAFIEATGHSMVGGFYQFWLNSGSDAYLGNPLTEDYELNGAHYQVFERGQLKWTKDEGVTLVPIGQELAKKYGLDTSPLAQGDLPTYDEALFIPPPEPTAVPTDEPTEAAAIEEASVSDGELWIDVNLSSQYMVVYQGNTSILETYVSTGRPGFDTPTGTFYINSMLEHQTMEGVIGGESYNVPDVPWVMYFTNEGHAIHGAYWHNNFGAVMSHGCVNMPVDQAAYLFSIAYVGVRVEIHY